MLDIKYIRQHPDEIQEGIAKKQSAVRVEEVLRVDQEHRHALQQLEEARAKQKRLGAAAKGSSHALTSLKDEIQKLRERVDGLDQSLEALLLQLPNPPLPEVPVGKDESENIVLREMGEKPSFPFQPVDYLTLAERLDIIDVHTAAKVSGSRFGYLKGAAAELEFALVLFTLRTLTNPAIVRQIAESAGLGENEYRPFLPIVPPVMITPETYRRMARLDPGHDVEKYRLADDDLYLVGSAEHSLGPMHMDATLPEEQLPVRYIGFSTAFRREAGSYGKDMKGILRVHQFDKLEMEVFCLAERSRKEFDFIVACQEYLLGKLGIPYRVVAICTGDMGGPDALQIDLEAWFPGLGVYKETHTADLMTDYQARRLHTKVKRKDGVTELAHMIDATAFAIGRTIAAIIENHQQADGTVQIPVVLQPFLSTAVIAPRTV